MAALGIAALRRSGVRHVVSLIEPAEELRRGAYVEGYDTALARHGIGLSRFAVPDLQAPTVEQMRAILDDIDLHLRRGDIVFVHCNGGIGRAGTVAGCWLVRHGVAPPSSAIDRLNALRSGCTDPVCEAPQTPLQAKLIEGWQPGS